MAHNLSQHVVTISVLTVVFVDFVCGQYDSGYDSATSFLHIARFVIPVIILIAVCVAGGACCCRRKRLAAQRAAQQGMIPLHAGQNGATYPTTGVLQSQMTNDYSQSSGHTWGQPYVIQPPMDHKDSSALPPAYSEICPAPPPYPGFAEPSSNPSVK